MMEIVDGAVEHEDRNGAHEQTLKPGGAGF